MSKRTGDTSINEPTPTEPATERLVQLAQQMARSQRQVDDLEKAVGAALASIDALGTTVAGLSRPSSVATSPESISAGALVVVTYADRDVAGVVAMLERDHVEEPTCTVALLDPDRGLRFLRDVPVARLLDAPRTDGGAAVLSAADVGEVP